jgi:hypothetical protein
MQCPSWLRTGSAIVLTALVCLALGFYFGQRSELQDTRLLLDGTLLKISMNLDVAKSIRKGETDEALGLIDSMHASDLVLIRSYDSITFNDPNT